MNNLQIQLQIDPSPVEDHIAFCLEVDAEPLADFSYYAIDLEELFRSEREAGAFFIVTCWCGQPACAGIGKGIAVSHADGQLRWCVREPGPEREFVFCETDYVAALASLRREIKRFVAQRRYSGEGSYGLVAPYANEQYFRLGDEW